MVVCLLIASIGVWLSVPLSAHAQASGSTPPESGRALFESSCAACHASNGAGAPVNVVGFDTPLPDFTDCSFATPEADVDWLAVAHQGGPVRAFDRRMPAFGDALAEEELLRIIQYIRGFCTDRAWPMGELNLPRPLVTEKAFPENEAVLTTTVTRSGLVGNTFLYEQRFGPRNQFEIAVPIDFRQSGGGGWTKGLGDLAVAVKRVLFHSADTGTIFSVAGELVLPTGSEGRGLGKGVTVFEPYVALGQILPSDSFVQVQAGVELPSSRVRASTEAFFRTAYGMTFMEARFGRSWTPIVEMVAVRELTGVGRTQWDAVPQMQVSLSRRQHILANAGIRLPVSQRDGRGAQFIMYLLWDWFDGGFFEGWR
jgi:mono/diheme cytochrome c family protein